jgi:four helix bundle protein
VLCDDGVGVKWHSQLSIHNSQFIQGHLFLAKGEDIQGRLIDFAVAVIKFCSEFPKGQASRHISSRLIRCGTAPAPNYGEARGAESSNDFIHKLGISLKELNETGIWFEIVKRGELVPINRIEPLIKECMELSKIISASICTVGKKEKN